VRDGLPALARRATRRAAEPAIGVTLEGGERR
jgi:hypothetical protein